MLKKYFPSKEQTKWQLPYYQRNKYWKSEKDDAYDVKPNNKTVEEEAHIAIQCTKLNLTKEVYQQRVAAVVAESNACKLQVGDTVYPTKPKDKTTYGRMQVVGICRNYDHYGTIDWNDPPFILSVQSLADRTTIVNCTNGWVESTLKENAVEC